MGDTFEVMRDAIKTAKKTGVDIAVFVVKYGELMGGGYTSDEAVSIVLEDLTETEAETFSRGDVR